MRIATIAAMTTLVLTITSGSGLAQTPAAAGNQQADTGDKNTIAGMKFGVGLSFTWDTVDRQRVEDATVDANGVVRVTKKNDAIARVMLETHYFFKLRGKETTGWGPFVAAQPGSDEIINALGAGFMFGWRRKQDSDESFNLGFGYSVDPATKVLGDEFVENKPAPPGPDGRPLPVRFQTRDQGGFLMLASFTWR